jgi:hypothetical protein
LAIKVVNGSVLLIKWNFGFLGRLKCLQVREVLRVGGSKARLDVGINLRLRDIETKRNVKFSQIPQHVLTTPNIS